MSKQIFGAFNNVDIKKTLDFQNIHTISVNMRNCAKVEMSVIYTDKVDEQGFFVGGHSEPNNEPKVYMFPSYGGVGIVVEQMDARGEGLLRVTLALPIGTKLMGLRSEGSVVEYNLIDVDIDRVNLANQKGGIRVKGKIKNLGVYSKYYPVKVEIELTQDALIQLGSRTGDVDLKLINAKKVNLKRKPEGAKLTYRPHLVKEGGYKADVFLPPQADGKYNIC